MLKLVVIPIEGGTVTELDLDEDKTSPKVSNQFGVFSEKRLRFPSKSRKLGCECPIVTCLVLV